MNSVQLGELVVQIRGDVTKLVEAQAKTNDSLDKIEKKSASVSQSVQRNVTRMAQSFTIAVGAIVLMTSRAAQGAEQLTRLSQQTGISATRLSELKAVAESVGVEFAVVEQAIKGWNATVVETSQNINSRAAIAIRSLGLNVREVMALPFDQVLERFADALGPFEDGQRKAAVATALLKEGGAELIPVLNLTARGMRQAGDEARRNGLVQSNEGVKAATEYTRAWKRLNAELDVFLNEHGAPVLNWLTSATRELRKFIDELAPAARLPLPGDPDELRLLEEGFERLTRRADEFKKLLQGSSAWDRFFDFNNVQARLTHLNELIGLTQARLMTLREQANNQGATGKAGRKPEAPEQPNLQLAKEELDAFIERLNGLPVLFGEAFALDTQPYVEAMARIDAATEKGAHTAQQATKMKLQLQRQEQDLILETASMAAQTLTTLFAKNKGAAIGAAVINTAVGVTRALSASPPPYNFIQAGLVAAAGAAQIASIRSATQTGGSQVGGGGGGGGSDGGAERSSPGLQQTLLVEGLREDQLLTGSMVRTLAERLLEYQRDGGEVVLVPRR